MQGAGCRVQGVECGVYKEHGGQGLRAKGLGTYVESSEPVLLSLNL